ncbi:RUN and FYVE domain-containing protein 4 [Molossus molossus]|uniref:RUN and FYVE domain-containing protein 4 n=2 Tax=Molossus molossus TaxID=27622 RepID=A0A7J8FTQ6_MOLMO|nr:RUN and FYVE domain-containing protein 4 [Molossus molossus]XP_036110207.1 RUN and FYVE domain-containing protein 4 [Molossus molossus]KAF6451036.1 RUN and FYVE domain containing 4 [Molossus molossus]
MAEEGTAPKVARDLKAAVSAILRGYGGGQSVTDASAELHSLCGCLEQLLQFNQKQQKSFLGPRKDYWDFLCTALWRQRGNTEPALFVRSQDKLKTPLGKGRAFIRFCLAHGQLAECLQLCLLNPELTREWYGPQSPLVCPELQEDILDSLYALNGVTFNLDLQRPDLDEAWPMFSESHCPSSSLIQGRRRKNKDSPKEISAINGSPKGVQPEEPHTSQASCLRDAQGKDRLAGLPTSQQHSHLPPFLEKKKEDPRSLRAPHSMWEPGGEELQEDQEMRAPRMGLCLENSIPSIQGQKEGPNQALKEVVGTEGEDRGGLLSTEGQRTRAETHKGEAEWGQMQELLVSSPRTMNEDSKSRNRQEYKVPSLLGEPSVLQGLGTKEGSTTEKPREQTGVTRAARREEQAEVALQDVVKNLRHRLRKTKEQAQHQEQRLKEQERELKALQEQLSRCQEERARLQAELEQKQQEAERRGTMYEEELGRQQDLVQAMKRRLLELIQEKDNLWQKVQHLSSVVPGCCVGCSKLFGRLSRRYPCRLCGGLVCHACSVDYKKRACHCPACAQKGEAQVI